MTTRTRVMTEGNLDGIATQAIEIIDGTCAQPSKVTSAYDITSSGIGQRTVTEMTDVVTPNFAALVAKGKIINNDMERVEQTIISEAATIYREHMHKKWWTTCNPAQWIMRGHTRSGTVCLDTYSSELLSAPVTTQIISDMKARAVTNAWAKVDFSEASALVTLAEANKTLDSFTSILKGALKYYKAWKALNRGDYRAFKRYLKVQRSFSTNADRYMEIRYGLRPLVYDALAIINAIKADGKQHPPRVTFRSGESWDNAVTDIVRVDETDDRYTDLLVTTTVSVEVRSGVLVGVENISRLNIWGMDSIVQAMWDVTPLSFVWDWFFNIGKVLSSWAPESGVTALASWVTTEKTVTQTLVPSSSGRDNCVWADVHTSGEWQISGGIYQIITITKTREADPSRPIMPRFKLRLSPAKLLDLALILKGFYKS